MGLNQRAYFALTSLILALLIQGCSVTSWTVVDEGARDTEDFEIIDTRYLLQSTNGINPEQPLAYFDLYRINTYEYTQRVQTERYVQQYRPRLGYVLLGAAGAGLSYYAAFSDQLLSRPTDTQRYALMGAGTLLTGVSFLNMKPVGEPKKTGESRLLRQTGTETEVDTLASDPYQEETARLRVRYNGDMLIQSDNWPFDGNRLSINLADNIDASIFEEEPAENLVVEATYDTLQKIIEVPVASVFERFVVVDKPLTALRNEPEVNPDNVLNDLAEGSQLKLVSRQGDWFKVLYGISETWIAANDVRTIWRPSDFASDLSVIAIPNVPFGSVDVEQDIPVLAEDNSSSSALILSNFRYDGAFSEKNYGQRDVQLMEAYFQNAFRVRDNFLATITNTSSQGMVARSIRRLQSAASDSSHTLYVYLGGFTVLKDDQLHLAGPEYTDDTPKSINLHWLFEQLGAIENGRIIVFADFDFFNFAQDDEILQETVEPLISQNPSSAVIFSSILNQQSGIYSSPGGDQKRHSIFTYFLADAFKNGNTYISDIMSYLDRNVTFISRSLYERPQTPILFGNNQLEIVN
ncbi:hypothetical protein [Gracilimonas mengyeensis]|uniref:SH3 domain-containing protein n=1 Tax=Gracilimonas mengyeensis TaxID=1302730 RepID=A0A521ANK7_9BACT|nr:hypothetical protein [Gracilimonas mengyeensis]SMO36378.1 hypothetical protein SAMN06265219_101273 [Gracilimonas mengyeensis]